MIALDLVTVQLFSRLVEKLEPVEVAVWVWEVRLVRILEVKQSLDMIYTLLAEVSYVLVIPEFHFLASVKHSHVF